VVSTETCYYLEAHTRRGIQMMAWWYYVTDRGGGWERGLGGMEKRFTGREV
jgi:hypothetical protein